MHDVSPPPLKRRKLSVAGSLSTSPSDLVPSRAEKNSRLVRVFSWNVNGVKPFLQRSISLYFTRDGASDASSSRSAASLRAFLQRHGWPQLLFLQEVKIATKDTATQNAVRAAVNAKEGKHDDGPSYNVHFTLPRDPHNARGFGGKVYGVASIVREDFEREHVTAVREVDWDQEGRVNVVETKSKLAIYNIYAVNGTDHPYRSPETGKEVGTRHDRKLAFHRLLLGECKRLESEGWRLILAGDMNIARSRIDGHPNLRTFPQQHVLNRADFNAKFFDDEKGLQAIDVWRHLHPDEKRYTYHSRGREWGSSCDRVDFVIVSRSLLESVTGADILDNVKERGPSDHVPIVIEFIDHAKMESSSLQQ